ncbi:tyrosine-type recombinase/integrase [Arthrobacter sp. GMC3]|uniref:tyrosine-type recombinase/integrase n=1 Tax=Arthrobacter sp. GMC3 TaxID=2058894 RepID=UPI0015E39495|nr:tyrosine-type recombinase/integrase [Arthrobacter sp. GMC3]
MARVVDLWHKKDRSRSARYGEGKRWRAVWTEGDSEKVKHFDAKGSAEDHLTWVRHHQRSGTYIDAELGRVFVRDLMDDWVATLVHYKASTLDTVKSDVSATILPYWGGTVLADITKADVQRWVTGMDKAARTVETIHGRLLGFLEWCVGEGRLGKNPAKGVNLPEGKKRQHRFLTVAQVAAIADTIDSRYKGMVWVLATTGIRMGEACELRAGDLDERRRRITISRAVVKTVIGTPKNRKTRTVPVTPTAMAYLAVAAEGKGGDDLLFTTARGQQIRANNFKRRDFDGAVKKINDAAAARKAKDGLAGVMIPAGLWVHDLRHTAASWAVQAGASVKSVQRMLGHATAAMTLDVYAGLFDQDLDDVAVRMEAILNPPKLAVPD